MGTKKRYVNMLLDLPPSLSPNHSETTSCFDSIYNVNSRQHLTYMDDDEGDQGVENATSNSKQQGEEEGTVEATDRNGDKLAGLRQMAIILISPLFLSPLLLSGEPEYKCAFCVALMAAYWLGQVMPLAITALLPAVLFPLMGILPAKEVSKEFLNDANFLFFGGLMVATAVEKCGLHERVAVRVLTLVGSEPRRIMFGFMLITAVLSMFISNTATTAMMLPISQSVVNLLGDNQQRDDTALGKNHLLTNARKRTSDCLHQQPSRMAKGLIISIAFAANIGGVGTLTGTPPNLVLVGMLSTLFRGVDTGVNYLSWMALTLPLMLGCLLVCWLVLCLFFLRTVPRAERQIALMMQKRNREMPSMSFSQKSVALCFLLLLFLWIGRDPGFMPGIGALFADDFYSDSTSAMLIGILLFLLPAEMPLGHRRIGKEHKSSRLMDWPTMQQQFPWSVVLLLGGGFSMAAGVRESGLSKLIGQALGQMDQQPVWVLQLICIFVTMFVTNICSNTVTASIFIPIVANMAQRSGIHPLGLMLPTTLACSFAFILPVGSPPNAIVFSSGLLSVSDMVFSGLTISAFSTIAIVIYSAIFVPILLPINNFPEWAVIDINRTEEIAKLITSIENIPEPSF